MLRSLQVRQATRVSESVAATRGGLIIIQHNRFLSIWQPVPVCPDRQHIT